MIFLFRLEPSRFKHCHATGLALIEFVSVIKSPIPVSPLGLVVVTLERIVFVIHEANAAHH